MKNIFIASLFMLLLGSCSTDITDSDASKFEIEKINCIPFQSTNFTTSDISTIPTDESTMIVGHRQEGDCLILDTRFEGGCMEHELFLHIDLSGQSSVNLNTGFPAILSHNNIDSCEAFIAFEVFVDISEFRNITDLSQVEIVIDGYDQVVRITL